MSGRQMPQSWEMSEEEIGWAQATTLSWNSLVSGDRELNSAFSSVLAWCWKKRKAVPEKCLLWRKWALNKNMSSLERNQVRYLLNSWLKEEWYVHCCFHRAGLDSYLDGDRKLNVIWRTENLENTSVWQKTEERKCSITGCWALRCNKES